MRGFSQIGPDLVILDASRRASLPFALDRGGGMGILLDIDGTLLDGGLPVDGAAEALAELRSRGIPLLFATNISRKSRATIAASLRETGLPANDDEVLNASWAAAVRLRSAGVRRVHLLLTPDAAADWGGFDLVEEDAEAVVVGDMGRLFDFARLERAYRCLRAGARLVAAHRNPTWKGPDGWTLDAGAFVVALEYAAGREAELIGKPARGFFEMAARILGCPAPELSIVGDDLDVDVAGGRDAGLRTYLVRTGKFDAAKLASAPAGRAPHVVLDSIRELPSHLP
jgi:HAD superfamily hydrolase (TIGR01458 family)